MTLRKYDTAAAWENLGVHLLEQINVIVHSDSLVSKTTIDLGDQACLGSYFPRVLSTISPFLWIIIQNDTNAIIYAIIYIYTYIFWYLSQIRHRLSCW